MKFVVMGMSGVIRRRTPASARYSASRASELKRSKSSSLGRVREGWGDPWRLDLGEASVPLRPDARPPCRVQRVNRALPLSQPLTECRRGLVLQSHLGKVSSGVVVALAGSVLVTPAPF